jgi:hypothetical protein
LDNRIPYQHGASAASIHKSVFLYVENTRRNFSKILDDFQNAKTSKGKLLKKNKYNLQLKAGQTCLRVISFLRALFFAYGDDE